ncbi:MAG: hypothetical protein AMXMBFR53_15820 [Gemmatimonadota bacterium]
MSPFQLITVVLLAAAVLLLLVLVLRKPAGAAPGAGEASPIGVPGPFGRESVAFKTVANTGETFRVELPGGIARLGRRHYGELIPVAVVGAAGAAGGAARRARLVFTEDDRAVTDRALSVFTQHKKAVPERFSILAEAEGTTYEDILAGVEAGTLGKDTPVAVTLRVSAHFRGSPTAVVSNPFKGWMMPLSERGPGGYEGETEGSHLWDCHAHWYHFFGTGRHTLCHGPCTTGTCLTWWNRKQWEDGWCICSC